MDRNMQLENPNSFRRQREILEIRGHLRNAVNQAKSKLRRWLTERENLAMAVGRGIAEANRSFHVATGFKIGGAVLGVAGGIMAIVGYALLIPSFGAALPLAIFGTAIAVSGGVSGGAAAVGNAVEEERIRTDVNKSLGEGAGILDGIVNELLEDLVAAVTEIHQLDSPQLSAEVRRQVDSLRSRDNLAMLLEADEPLSENQRRVAEMTECLVAKLEAADKKCRYPEMKFLATGSTAEIWLSVPPDQPVGNLDTGQGYTASDFQPILDALSLLLSLFVQLVKIRMVGTAKSGEVNPLEVLRVTRNVWRGGFGIAEGALGAAGRAGAQTAARIVGLVGSAVFTGVDIGLAVYYSWRLHQFRTSGRVPELAQNLLELKAALAEQTEEVEGLAA